MRGQLVAQLKALRAVLAVADGGSTAAAARMLHLSQPAVARAVAHVEASTGLALFERGGRGMQPTQAGAMLVARTRRALAYLARADDSLWQQGAARGGRLATMITPRQMEVLVALDRHVSERRVARELGISQPAVHQALAQAEHLAGEPLFDRLVGGLRLTAKGEWVIQQVKLALAEWLGAQQELSELHGLLQGQLAIGTLPFSTVWVVPHAMERVTSLHPAVQVTVVDGTYEALLHQMRRADVDILVGALRTRPPQGMRQIPLFDDPLAVVVRAGHPWSRNGPTRLADIGDAQWILPMPGAPARAALDEVFAAESLPSPAGVQINSPTLIQALLLASDRLALMSPRQIAHEIKAGLFTVLPLPVRHTRRTIGYTVREDFEPTPALRHFMQALHLVSS